MSNDERLVDSELADSAPQGRGGPWRLILVIIVLTVIGVWLVPGEPPEPGPEGDATRPQNPAPSLLDGPNSATDASTATGDLAPSDDAPPGVIDDSPGAHARALIAQMRDAGEIDPQAVFDAAERAQADGQLADAYLLYFFAAREGHARAALTLGRQADPHSHVPGNSVFADPDPVQAHKWYQLAAQQGDEDGRQQLSALRERVGRQAADGDPQAQRTLLLWQ